MGLEIVVSGIAGFLFTVPVTEDFWRAPQPGVDPLVGLLAKVLPSDNAEPGATWVLVRGERWQAKCSQPLKPGTSVRVNAVRGLEVEVSPTVEAPVGSSERSRGSAANPWLVAAGVLWVGSVLFAALGEGSVTGTLLACPVVGLSCLLSFGDLDAG